MYYRHTNRRAQAITEHAFTIAMIVTVAIAMTIILRRAMQGRIKDAKDTMMEMVRTGAPVNIAGEYEPYYLDTVAEVERSGSETIRLLPGGATGIFRKSLNSEDRIETTSRQAPARDAD